MSFREKPVAWGRVALRTWDRRADERLWRLREREGVLNEAISALMSEGYYPTKQRLKNNMVVNTGFNLLLSFLGGVSGTAGLQYVALGSSTVSPAPTDTQLGTEVSRIAVTSFSQQPNDLTVTGYWGTGQANVSLAEAGIFGNGATATANSGTLYSHVGFAAFTKDDLESLTAQWDLGYARPS